MENAPNPAPRSDEDGFRTTGSTSKGGTDFYFTTRDLLFFSILGVLGGIISSVVPFSLLIKVWYPFTGGTQLVSGHHVLWMTMAYGLTRKHGAPTVTASIKGLFEFLLGDNWGLFIVVINLVEGAAADVMFYLMRRFREDHTKLGWALSGGVGNFVQAPIFWAMAGRLEILPSILAILAFTFAFISGVLISGLLGRFLVKSLHKAGVPSPDFLEERSKGENLPS